MTGMAMIWLALDSRLPPGATPGMTVVREGCDGCWEIFVLVLGLGLKSFGSYFWFGEAKLGFCVSV
jgi:hypothetical protein